MIKMLLILLVVLCVVNSIALSFVLYTMGIKNREAIDERPTTAEV